MDDYDENVLEFLTGQRRATISATKPGLISLLKGLAAGWPKDCRIEAENSDGTLTATVPVKWIRIGPPAE